MDKSEDKKRKKNSNRNFVADKSEENVRRKKGSTTKMIVAEKSSEDGKKPKQRAQDPQLLNFVSKYLMQHSWYHGLMPREEIEELLQVEGNYLVRRTTEKGVPLFCLSVRHEDQVRHFPLQYENAMWNLRNLLTKRHPDLVDLLNELVNEKFELPPSMAVLGKAIPRPDYYFLHDNITLDRKLGSGAFGEVWKGKLKLMGYADVDVAVKRMKGNVTKKVIAEFMHEAKLMRQLTHKNIVSVFGVAPQEEPLMIVLELAANGTIKSYCKVNPNCPISQLVSFATDSVRGMSYLSSKKVIHRDLAARNLLLGSMNEVKISDFGLSVAGKTEVTIEKMKLPIKWLAPETLESGRFTTKTDVWSFGVTLWEIFSRCTQDPFPGLTNALARELIKTQTPPMQPPPETPPLISQMMNECFRKSPEERPFFPVMLKRLSPEEDVTEYDVGQSPPVPCTYPNAVYQVH
ncbi:unnamed protein product [Caenorhabditis auriculariae]|uniref:Tyrosine-protein kinase n=1 Tax=Caenorhabditis auriculariae TaxID=2777116 RepID=A0A8S1HBT9_9PELO|nr:unnamed protein product [Caenorhabditis auriculariae]